MLHVRQNATSAGFCPPKGGFDTCVHKIPAQVIVFASSRQDQNRWFCSPYKRRITPMHFAAFRETGMACQVYIVAVGNSFM